ncbi:MAG: hypothetical protein GXN99_03355, partial [Candidatus Nanohaloarchaeota archaeon]|nr:hypothetical protein [Candidatus Nanohaloarchaeota archaeon]
KTYVNAFIEEINNLPASSSSSSSSSSSYYSTSENNYVVNNDSNLNNYSYVSNGSYSQQFNNTDVKEGSESDFNILNNGKNLSQETFHLLNSTNSLNSTEGDILSTITGKAISGVNFTTLFLIIFGILILYYIWKKA